MSCYCRGVCLECRKARWEKSFATLVSEFNYGPEAFQSTDGWLYKTYFDDAVSQMLHTRYLLKTEAKIQ